ncbi:MAG: glycosyltransferase family 4 protein [Pseudomonadota bacterium]
MKLLYLLATPGGWGGLEKHVFEVAGAMAARGHEVVVLADPAYRERSPAGVVVEPFDWRSSRRNPLLWWRLRRALRRIGADIVHAHADKPVGALMHAGHPAGTLTIGTVHNTKSGYRAYRGLDAVIAVSGEIAAEVGHPDVHVVHNGTRETTPDPAALAAIRQWCADKPAPVVLAIGRLVPAKGFDLLLQAWPDGDAGTLVVLGDGRQEAELRQLAATRGLRHVYLQGASGQVREWIAAADLLVISSRNEGGPYTLAEALVAGLPAIGTRVGMVPDFLPPSCIVPPGDVEALRGLLAQAVTRPEHFRALCASAVLEARRRLVLPAMMDATEAVYRAAWKKYGTASPGGS